MPNRSLNDRDRAAVAETLPGRDCMACGETMQVSGVHRRDAGREARLYECQRCGMLEKVTVRPSQAASQAVSHAVSHAAHDAKARS